MRNALSKHMNIPFHTLILLGIVLSLIHWYYPDGQTQQVHAGFPGSVATLNKTLIAHV